jgi:hypothetical protein
LRRNLRIPQTHCFHHKILKISLTNLFNKKWRLPHFPPSTYHPHPNSKKIPFHHPKMKKSMIPSQHPQVKK